MEQIENNDINLKPKISIDKPQFSNIEQKETTEIIDDSNVITPQQQEDYTQDSIIQPVPAQNQLPADSYLYANTTNIGGVIQSVSDQYGLDPHKLEALTNTIRNKQANLSGFYNMQIGYYPGMSAESLVTSLGRVSNLSNVISDNRRQEAELKGEAYTSNGFDDIIDSLQSIDGKKPGKVYYQEALSALQEADHMKFDTQTLSEYYETLVRSGASKAEAWTRTMGKQDAYRAAQDERALKQDFLSMITPAEMDTYTAALYTKVQQTSDPETRLRLYSQYQTAKQLAKNYSDAYAADPAAYLQAKDPAFQGLLTNAQKNRDFSEVITALDERYNVMQVPESQRKYLTQEQLNTAANEINTFLSSDPIKAQSIIVGLNQSYGKNAGKVINQLITEGKVDPSAKALIEAIKTGSPVSNEDVLNMLKNKLTYKSNYAKEMLGVPDTKSAQVMRQKLEARVYDTPGYQALVSQLDLAGNLQGKIEMAQFYADMALFYKYKNPSLSDKQAVEMVQKNLIDNVYDYDAQSRVILQKRTLDGKPIKYNKYGSKQTINYLTNRQFTGQNIQVGDLTPGVSEELLKDNTKIIYRVLPDGHTVQPIYSDDNGTTLSLFTGAGPNRQVLTLDLRQLGDEDIIGVIEARDSARKLVSLLTNAANIPSGIAVSRGYAGPIDTNTANAAQTLNELGFELKHLDTTKSFSEQFDRTKMSPRRIDALSNIMIKQQEFELELQRYERLKKAQRDAASPRLNAVRMLKPFVQDIMFRPGSEEESRLYKSLKSWEAEKTENLPELKKARENLYRLEDEILSEAGIFMNYKGKLPNRPLTKLIDNHALMDKILWGGY